MSAEPAVPLTFGQLSVWRDVEHVPAERRHEANLLRTAPVDADVSVADLLGAFHGLQTHHEALRTTYDFSDAAGPRQIIHPAGARDLPVSCLTVDGGADPEAVGRKVGEETSRRPFDLTAEASWRAVIMVADGRPVQLAVVLHHIAVDIWAMNLLDNDFQTLLKGGRPDPSDSPRELALAQRSERWQRSNGSAEQHQRTVFAAVARAGGPDIVESPAMAVKATLRSSAALAGAVARAASLQISVPSLVLAAYCFAAHRTTEADTILVNAMCANRLYPGSAMLVSSMNQWGPFASELAAAEPFDRFARRVHWANLRAYRHGCYDPYVAERIRGEVAATAGPISPAFSFNFVQAAPATAAPAASEPASPPWVVEHETPNRTTGPTFYLVATRNTALSLTCRVMWEGFDGAALEDFLVRVHDLLR